MSCKKVHDLCSAYIDGYLTTKEIRLLETHLQTCGHCRQYLEELKTITNIFSEFRPVEVPSDVSRELNAKLRGLNANNQLVPNYIPWKYALSGVASATAIFLVYLTVKNSYLPEDKKSVSIVKKPVVSLPVSKIPVIARKIEVSEPAKLESVKPEIEQKVVTTKTEEINKQSVAVAQSEPVFVQAKEVTLAVEKLKQDLVTNHAVASTDVAKTVESMNIMISKGVSVNDARRVIDTAVGNRLGSEKIAQVSRAVGNVNPPRESTGQVRAAPVRKTVSATEFKFEKVYPAIFTPNGDDVNPKAEFYFDNPENKEVSIRIFDLSATLVKEVEITSGVRPFWDGKNQNGEIVEGGIYIYQLKVGNDVVKGIVTVAK